MEDFLEALEGVPSIVLWLIVFGVSAFTALIAFALSYHWREYTIDSSKKDYMYKGYLVMSGILVALMILSLILYLS